MTSVGAPTMTAPSRRNLARSSVLTFAGSATSALMGLVLIVVLGRTLGEVGAGVVLQAVAAFTIALGAARLGMDSTALWILPRLLDSQEGLVRPTAWLLIGTASLGGCLGGIGLVITAQVLETTASGTETAAALRSIAPFLPFAAAMLTALAASRAMGKVTTFVLIGSIALPTLRPAAIVISVALGGSAIAAGIAWAIPLLPAAAAAVVILAVQMRQLRPSDRVSLRQSTVPARTARYAVPRVLSSLLEQLLVWLAVLVVGVLAGPGPAGIYGAAARFVAAGMVIDTAIRVVVSPMFSRLLHRDETVELEDLYRTAATWLVLFSAPIYLLLAIFSPLALSLLGDGFMQGAAVMSFMCLGALVIFLAGNIHSVLLMSGRSGLAALNKATAVATNIALLVLLVPELGLVGAAVAWAVACTLDALLATIQVRFVLRLAVSPVPALHPLLVGILTVAVPAMCLRVTMGPTWPALITAVAVGGAFFLVVCRLDRKRLRLDELSLLTRRRDRDSASGRV